MKTCRVPSVFLDLLVSGVLAPSRSWPATGKPVESPEGLSPPGAPRTVHDPLESHGSRCSAVAIA
jgi:hypothetical protein